MGDNFTAAHKGDRENAEAEEDVIDPTIHEVDLVKATMLPKILGVIKQETEARAGCCAARLYTFYRQRCCKAACIKARFVDGVQ